VIGVGLVHAEQDRLLRIRDVRRSGIPARREARNAALESEPLRGVSVACVVDVEDTVLRVIGGEGEAEQAALGGRRDRDAVADVQERRAEHDAVLEHADHTRALRDEEPRIAVGRRRVDRRAEREPDGYGGALRQGASGPHRDDECEGGDPRAAQSRPEVPVLMSRHRRLLVRWTSRSIDLPRRAAQAWALRAALGAPLSAPA
jgi:hypothetical protein